MPKLIVKATADLPEKVIELKSGVTRIGRGQRNDFIFPFPEISETHCEILVDGEYVFVRDLESSNGTFIDGDPIRDSALYTGQVLQVGNLNMVLDVAVQITLPELPKPQSDKAPVATILSDGFSSCINHSTRHAVWECGQCTRVYCDECIRRLRRVGGANLKLCPACSNPCKLSAWSEMVRKKKKNFFGVIVGKLTDSIKRTTSLLKHPPRD